MQLKSCNHGSQHPSYNHWNNYFLDQFDSKIQSTHDSSSIVRRSLPDIQSGHIQTSAPKTDVLGLACLNQAEALCYLSLSISVRPGSDHSLKSPKFHFNEGPRTRIDEPVVSRLYFTINVHDASEVRQKSHVFIYHLKAISGQISFDFNS